MKKSRVWKIWLVIGVAALWLWQANKTVDESQSIIIRGELGELATNVFEARGQEFEVRGDFVYIDASDKEETANNLSAALKSLRYGGATQQPYFMMGTSQDKFPVFGPNWEPIGYYDNDNVSFEYDPNNESALKFGDKKGYVRKTKLDYEAECKIFSQQNHDLSMLLEALRRLDDRIVASDNPITPDLPCLGKVSWDTERPIQKL